MHRMMDVWINVFAALVSAIIGGAIAGVFSLRAVDKTYEESAKAEDARQKAQVRAFLQAIHDEIETVWEHYQVVMGALIELLPDGQPLNFYFPISQEYFTIFNNSASMLGQVDDADLRRLIVQVYIKSKGLLDSYRFNNNIVGHHEQAVLLFNQTQNQAYDQQAQFDWARMIDYAKKMKTSHAELKILVSQLLRRLKQMGVITDPSRLRS